MTDLQAPTRREQQELPVPTPILAAPQASVPSAPITTLLAPPKAAVPGSVPLVPPNQFSPPAVGPSPAAPRADLPDASLAPANVPFGAPPVLASIVAALPAVVTPDSVDPVSGGANDSPVALAAMAIPSLPSNTAAAASPVATPFEAPPAHQPSQVGSYASAADWLHTNSPVSAPTSTGKVSSAGGVFLRTLLLAVLTVGLGAAAHIGYDRYEARDGAAGNEATTLTSGDLTAWPRIDPPAIRYADTSTTIETVNGTRELAAHRDLVSGNRITTVTDTDLDGNVNTYDVDVRGEQAFLRTSETPVWAPIEIGQARSIVGDNFQDSVFTVSEVFPLEALPHTVVLESVERQIPLNSIRQDIRAQQPSAADEGPTGAVRPRPRDGVELTAVRHYRVIIDTEAFRLADGAAFETWERQLGGVASARLEVWVDLDGFVRQFRIENEGTMSRQTLIGGAPSSNRFDLDPLQVNEQAATIPLPVDPTVIVDPAPDELLTND